MRLGEFAVWQFFPDGGHERVCRGVDAQEAVMTAKRHTENVAAKTGLVSRVIIVDDGDNTTFEWKYGEGVTYPPHDGNKYIADEPA